MDDQRCPLEEGQAGAAEATAAPSVEDRAGEYSLGEVHQPDPALCLGAPQQAG